MCLEDLLNTGGGSQQTLAAAMQLCLCSQLPLLPPPPLAAPSDWATAVDEIKQAVEFLRSEGAPKVRWWRAAAGHGMRWQCCSRVHVGMQLRMLLPA